MARVAVRVALKGDKEMLQKLQRLVSDQGMRKELRKAVIEVADIMVVKTRDRTPVKTGKLKDSIVRRVMVSPKKEDIRVSIMAGGPDVLYARRVHEQHKTKSKFLESVILESAGTAGRDIAEKIDLKMATGA